MGSVQPQRGAAHREFRACRFPVAATSVQSVSPLFLSDASICHGLTRRPPLPSPSAARRGGVTSDLGPSRDGGPGPPHDSLAGLPHLERAGLPHT